MLPVALKLPSPRRGENHTSPSSTGSAALHPWLHPIAPLGRKTKYLRIAGKIGRPRALSDPLRDCAQGLA